MRKFSMVIGAMFMAAAMLFFMPAKAEEVAGQGKKETTINIQSDAQMDAASKAYDAAIADLSADQKAELEKLGNEFAGTMEPDMQILSRAAELEHCATHDETFKADGAKHTAAFIRWRDAVNADQEKLWAAHRTLRKKITYIDQAVLDDYYMFQAKLMLQLMGGMTILARENGGFAKTDCAGLAAELDAVPQTAQNPENAPKTAE